MIWRWKKSELYAPINIASATTVDWSSVVNDFMIFYCTMKFIGHFSHFRLPYLCVFSYLFPSVKRGDLGDIKEMGNRRKHSRRQRIVKLFRRSIAKHIQVYGIVYPVDAYERKKAEKWLCAMKHSWIKKELKRIHFAKLNIQSLTQRTLIYLS